MRWAYSVALLQLCNAVPVIQLFGQGIFLTKGLNLSLPELPGKPVIWVELFNAKRLTSICIDHLMGPDKC